jgi:hypothetical protein
MGCAGPAGATVFDLLVGLISALNQIGVLIAALGCGGLGALLVGHAVYWRLHAARVQGQVIGVRLYGNLFNAVYRYTLPSGQMCEATSLEGSSSTRGKETGALVPLLVIPEKAQRSSTRSGAPGSPSSFTTVGPSLRTTGTHR